MRQHYGLSLLTARTRASCELDVRYGDGARHTYDYFPVEDPSAPLVVYIHGGYWQGGDRKSYSFLAQAFNARGYSVCPVGSGLLSCVMITRAAESLPSD